MKVEEVKRKAEELAMNLTKLDDYQLCEIKGYVDCMVATKRLEETDNQVPC